VRGVENLPRGGRVDHANDRTRPHQAAAMMIGEKAVDPRAAYWFQSAALWGGMGEAETSD
jgi:hypothetical protein